jgi:hypothetical protein
MLKQARRKAGVLTDVPLHHDNDTLWYSVSSGPISVHCLNAEEREHLALEELAPSEGAITWWRPGARPLTLQDMRIDGDSGPLDGFVPSTLPSQNLLSSG